MTAGASRLSLLVFSAIVAAAPVGPSRATEAQAPILLYHRFHASKAGSTTVTTPVFDEQVAWLTQHHFQIEPLRNLVDALNGTQEMPPRAVAITVDDGRRSQYAEMFPIILRYHIPVTLFVNTDAISYEPDALTWEEIEEMERSGLVDVQSHTCSHPEFEKERARRSPNDFELFVASELTRSKATLERRLRRPVDYLAWPYGVDDRDLERAAERAGYSAAFIADGRTAHVSGDRYAISRIPVSDRDRGAAFEELLEGRAAVAATEDP